MVAGLCLESYDWSPKMLSALENEDFVKMKKRKFRYNDRKLKGHFSTQPAKFRVVSS